MTSGHDGDATNRVRRRDILAATGAVSATLLAGCRGTPEPDGMSRSNGDGSNIEWRSLELSTVRGDETFTIDGLDGPVVLQSFAVWCPKCEQQSDNLRDLDDSYTVVSLNTDANEDAATVREHANDNGFEWRFAIASTELTNGLISEFGPSVANAPSTPIIVACDGGSTAYSSGSIVTADEIASLASEC